MIGGTKIRLVVALCLAGARAVHAQLDSLPLAGTASKLDSVTYYPPPNEQQIEARMTGTDMVPLPKAQFLVKNMVIYKYGTNGVLQSVIEAPTCNYAQLDGVANSPGHLKVTMAGGVIVVEGDGFLWKQTEATLAISNNVSTKIRGGTMNLMK